jgi:tRNA(Ile)-lysidine synthase
VARPGRRVTGIGGPGFSTVERVLKTIEQRRLIETGDTIVVAVSGGPDSVALLDVLGRIATRLDLTLHVAHVDHGLSPGSDEVASQVATGAARAGFDAHVVRAPDLEGPNLHARARAFRYGFFDIVVAQTGARRVATGHTLDDRVETTLARLIHGAPPEGLAGIRYSDGNRIHPLLDVRRAETRSYCEERELAFVEDPANDDFRFERVAVRRLLVGAIEDRWGDAAVRRIAAAAQRLAEDAGALDGIAERLHAGLPADASGRIAIPRPTLEPLPRALRRRLLERAVGRVRDRHGGIEAALDALETGAAPGARFGVAGGREIVLERDEVVVSGGDPSGPEPPEGEQ